NLIFSRVDFETTNRQVGIISGKRIQLDITMQRNQSVKNQSNPRQKPCAKTPKIQKPNKINPLQTS
ncbi:hypothetical protein, partial [Flavobacterium macrobrachii]|uniref:hypothetical protein n=1 Tax=Flavobacterium macrobrachii TaxID=591204 RepID=UPI0037BE61D2